VTQEWNDLENTYLVHELPSGPATDIEKVNVEGRAAKRSLHSNTESGINFTVLPNDERIAY